MFITECPNLCIAHLRRLRSHDEGGEAKLDRLMRDLKQLELDLNIELLPDTARVSSNIAVFSKEEKIADMIEYSKYNK